MPVDDDRLGDAQRLQCLGGANGDQIDLRGRGAGDRDDQDQGQEE
jgi:hypothetical protein